MGEELKGKRVLVTGASSGLGAHFVRLLAGQGAEELFCEHGCKKDVSAGLVNALR